MLQAKVPVNSKVIHFANIFVHVSPVTVCQNSMGYNSLKVVYNGYKDET